MNKAIWKGQKVEVVRNVRPNLQGKKMVEIQVSPNQKYQVPLSEIKKKAIANKIKN